VFKGATPTLLLAVLFSLWEPTDNQKEQAHFQPYHAFDLRLSECPLHDLIDVNDAH
jgi:hypothetical protein